MERLEVLAAKDANGWKCIAPCLAICLMDTASPVLDIAGYAAGAISENA